MALYKLLTVVIPAYNMHDYLRRCLDSICVETVMNDVQVVVVNDGSTDDTSAIAHEYELHYPSSFLVIDKENGNYGSCINAALPLATGKYIKILDADDYFETSQFIAYLCHLSEIDVDLVMNDMDIVDLSNMQKSVYRYHLLPFTITNLYALSADFRDIWMHCVAYRNELLRRIKYRQTEGISYTDHEWIYLPLAASKSVYYISGVLYHYIIGREGQTISSSAYEKNFWMELKGLRVMADVLKDTIKNNNEVNGVSLNLVCMKKRLLTRCGFAYYQILNNPVQQHYIGQLKEFDNYIFENIPDLYKEIEEMPYPDYGQYKIRSHYIRTWHRYGLTMCRLQLWFTNHYMGLVCRIHGK